MMALTVNSQSSPFIAYDKHPCCKCNRFEIISSQTRYPPGHQCRRKNFMKAYKLLRDIKHSGRRGTFGWRGIVARIELSNPDDYEVGRLLGSYGYMNITSYASPQTGGLAAGAFENSSAGLSFEDIGKLSGQEVGEGNVQIRLYSGRVSRGPRMGTRVIFKAYPGRLTGGVEADVMAANELATHAFLQDVPEEEICPNLQILLGGFQTSTGEQWLVFRDDGKSTAANYATIAREATTEGRAVGEWEFWDRFNRDLPIKRRQVFIIKLLRGAFNGLSYMHTHNRLHQSLGPASVVLNIIEERDVRYLVPRLRDLAFAVDIRTNILILYLAGPTSLVLQDTHLFCLAGHIFFCLAGLIFGLLKYICKITLQEMNLMNRFGPFYNNPAKVLSCKLLRTILNLI